MQSNLKRMMQRMMEPVVDNSSVLLQVIIDQNTMFRDALTVLATSNPSLQGNVDAIQKDFERVHENLQKIESVRLQQS